MKRSLINLTALLFATLAALSAAEPIPAFLAAEGYGRFSTGGRGGTVYEVTNLDDSGPGSFREALSEGNRTVIFRVSGTIDLRSRLKVKASNITIAGQTAPGGGICLRRHGLSIIDAENVIIRFLRLRPGDEAGEEMDALTVWGSKDVILDHCSLSWSTDTLNDVVKESGNVTVQWCILSEPLNQSVHAKGAHGYAAGWDGRTRGGCTAHHNLIAHAVSRAPRIGFSITGRGRADVRNVVVYNSGRAYGGETSDFNFVNCYFRSGPTYSFAKAPIFEQSSGAARMHITGNVIEGRDSASHDNATAISFKPGNSRDEKPWPAPSREVCLIDQPVEVPPVKTHSAKQAYELVLAHAGAILPLRDAVDERIVNEVRNRTGKIIDSQNEVGGWPELKSGTAPNDTDHDGIPDDWEKQQGLNPDDASDRNGTQEDGYTNLEHYLNSLVPALRLVD